MRKHLSYANVTATLALVVAIGGGTAAVAGKSKQVAPKNSVTSKSIRDGAIKEADIASGAVKEKNIAPGQITASRLAPIAVSTTPGNAGPMAIGQAVTPCPAGTRLIGGGVGEGGPELWVAKTAPLSSNSWDAQMRNTTAGDIGFTGYALCLSGTP